MAKKLKVIRAVGELAPDTMWPDLERLGLNQEQIQELKDDYQYYLLERQMESV